MRTLSLRVKVNSCKMLPIVANPGGCRRSYAKIYAAPQAHLNVPSQSKVLIITLLRPKQRAPVCAVRSDVVLRGLQGCRAWWGGCCGTCAACAACGATTAGSTLCWRRPRTSACTCSPSCSCASRASSSGAWSSSARYGHPARVLGSLPACNSQVWACC